MLSSASLEKLSASFGSSLKTGAQFLEAQRVALRRPPLSVQVPFLDRPDQGLPRGSLVSLVGGISSGRYSLALAALASATKAGELAACIDFGDHLEARGAAQAGVELRRLLWLRPRRVKEALLSAEIVLGAGFNLVVLDFGVVPVPQNEMSEFVWMRLQKQARAQNAILLVISSERFPSLTADVELGLESNAPVWSDKNLTPRLLEGISCGLHVKGRKTEPLVLSVWGEPS